MMIYAQWPYTIHFSSYVWFPWHYLRLISWTLKIKLKQSNGLNFLVSMWLVASVKKDNKQQVFDVFHVHFYKTII